MANPTTAFGPAELLIPILDNLDLNNGKEIISKIKDIVQMPSFKNQSASLNEYNNFMDIFKKLTPENIYNFKTKLYNATHDLMDAYYKDQKYDDTGFKVEDIEDVNEEDMPSSPAPEGANQPTNGGTAELGTPPTNALAVISAPTGLGGFSCPFCSKKGLPTNFCDVCVKVLPVPKILNKLREDILKDFSGFKLNEDDTSNMDPHEYMEIEKYLANYFGETEFNYSRIEDIPDTYLKQKAKKYLDDFSIAYFLIAESNFVLDKLENADKKEKLNSLPMNIGNQLKENIKNIVNYLDNIFDDYNLQNEALRFEEADDLINKIFKLVNKEYRLNIEDRHFELLHKNASMLLNKINNLTVKEVDHYLKQLLTYVTTLTSTLTKKHSDVSSLFVDLKKLNKVDLHKGSLKLKANFGITSLYSNQKLITYLSEL